MSRIDDLIAEHCPDGVVYQELGSIARRTRGAGLSAGQMRALHKEAGAIRVFAAGSTEANINESDLPVGSVTRDVSVLVKARGNVGFQFCDFPFSHKSELWAYAFNEELLARFIYHYLKSLQADFQELAKAKSGKLPQLAVADTDELRVPVPPLAVQQEIVRILDAMEALEAELEAELEARRKQYEHYRNALLTFETPPRGGWMTLGELERSGAVKLGRGNVISKPDLAANPGEYPVYSSSATNNGEFGRYGKYMFDDERLTWSVDGGGRFFYREAHKYSVTNVCGWLELRDRESFSTRFLHYVLINQWATKKFDYVKKAHPSVIRDEYLIPVLPVDEQERIVNAISSFEAITEDLRSGLPAEIAARRKQYEYYRDKLLTFKEAS